MNNNILIIKGKFLEKTEDRRILNCKQQQIHMTNHIPSIGFIDDELAFLDLIRNNLIINDNRINTFFSSNYDSSFEWVKNKSVDALIVDLYLSHTENAVDFISEIRKIDDKIKIFAYSHFFNHFEIKQKLEHLNKNNVKIINRTDFVRNINEIVKEIISEIIKPKSTDGHIITVDNKQIIVKDINVVNREWSKILKKKPDDMHHLTSRQFEEFVAEIWYNRGYTINLTPSTRDGGKDIYAYKKNPEGEILLAIECKKYSPLNKVGRPIIQQLNGVVESEKLTGGIVATTSYFSKDAIDYANPLRYRIFLNDLQSLNDIINNEF